MFGDDDFPKMPGDWIFKVVPWIIGLAVIGVVVYWGAMIYVTYTVAKDPTVVAHRLGTIAHAFQDGFAGK